MISTPAPALQRRSLFKKQIPTLLGLVVLLAGLAIGAFLFSQGTGIFLPRATPETTPKSIRVSNVTDQGFSISFLTDAATSGFIRYGTDPDKLTQIGDQRDQLTGTVGEYTLHQISVLRGLEPNTTYYYVLGTGQGALFDDNGEPFTIKTAQKSGTQPKAMTIFGSVVTQSGSPAAGAIVFVTPPDAGTMSSLVTNTGSWAVSLSNARKKDGSDYAEVEIGDELAIQVFATDPNDNTQLTTPVEAETAISITLGKGLEGATTTPTELSVASPVVSPASSGSAQLSELTSTATSSASSATVSGTAVASSSGSLASLLSGSSPSSASAMSSVPAAPTVTGGLTTVLDLTTASESAQQTVETAQPVISGKAKPNVTISIQVNSDTQLDAQIQADENGNFELDVSQYEQELEPGEHTVTYSYVDPDSGETVTATRTFTVAPRVTLAQASTTATPFSTTNPYPIGGSAATTVSATAIPTPFPAQTISPFVATMTGTVSTSSSLLSAGSVGSTLLMVSGGLFFLLAGVWSWWIAKELMVLDS